MSRIRINPTEELKNNDCKTVDISRYTILEAILNEYND
jgi:hypothetical protein